MHTFFRIRIQNLNKKSTKARIIGNMTWRLDLASMAHMDRYFH